jgi:HEAT repeat protein
MEIMRAILIYAMITPLLLTGSTNEATLAHTYCKRLVKEISKVDWNVYRDDLPNVQKERSAVYNIRKKIIELGKSSFDEVVKLTRHKDANVRWNAALILGELGDDRGVEHLIPLLDSRERDITVRAWAADSLSKLTGLPRNQDWTAWWKMQKH